MKITSLMPNRLTCTNKNNLLKQNNQIKEHSIIKKSCFINLMDKLIMMAGHLMDCSVNWLGSQQWKIRKSMAVLVCNQGFLRRINKLMSIPKENHFMKNKHKCKKSLLRKKNMFLAAMDQLMSKTKKQTNQ